MKHKFKVGDQVQIINDSTVSDILADMIGDVDEGVITYNYSCKIERALREGKPLIIDSIEDDGYVLALKKGKPFSGQIEEKELELVKPRA